METNLIEDLRLLKAPDYSWILWGAGAVVLVGWGLWSWFHRKGPARPPSTDAAGADYWDEAMRGLERLASLLRPEESRAYGMGSTAVLRHYIEKRFGVQAPFQATEEFLVAAGTSAALPPADRERLADFLRWCDLLKFGRAVAEADELRQMHGAAVEFVMGSRPMSPGMRQEGKREPEGRA